MSEELNVFDQPLIGPKWKYKRHFLRRMFIFLIAFSVIITCVTGQKPLKGIAPIVVIGGDTHFGENYASRKSFGGPWGNGQNVDYSRGFFWLKPLLDRAMWKVVNLETPLSSALNETRLDKEYVHWAHAENAGRALAAGGINAVGLANNHVLDQGPQGLKKTFSTLNRYGIGAFGAGMDLSQARAPLVRKISLAERRARTVAIFGMFEVRRNYREKLDFYADTNKLGVAPIDVAAFAKQVSVLRKTDPNAFVIAYPHWGKNYMWATDTQVEIGHALIDAGADIVIGHHAHTLQEIERYKSKWILYGIGNFIFNAPGRYAKYPSSLPFSLVVELVFGGDPTAIPRVKLHPFLSDNLQTRYQPRPASADEARIIMGAIRARPHAKGFAAELVDDSSGTKAILLTSDEAK
ncbi:poly-gamma-glutamate capsule biosynthesis protein CapA/YwtB (metallophosphatase superfamily) [Sphingorhabdus rigui]|uniref:Poly-gamma-glutamate capsule biosynthesis protein CapA/YwtB (Metallophosphatase superfamily) n=1 Tax=Sphingorhabdus rigui TaxID=1282858 RepID=A0A840B3W2_9SPHN|nr:CapA family protein [Sphingorhabdus rigui]MBB3943847.1 poly-gamma-glutamate capsule biosynthesis protein CapA/YwtB (metallophosphatase superfamily) [Sphingorhabdus rigui]